MVLAVSLGILAGLIGFIPLLIGLRMTKRLVAIQLIGQMGFLMLMLAVSSVWMLLCAVVFVAYDRSNALGFALAEAIMLIVFALSFGIYDAYKRK